MSPPDTSNLTIQETDEAGNSLTTYLLTVDSTGKRTRVDTISASSSRLQRNSPATVNPTARLVSFLHYLVSIFLPSGFPHSVRPDYVPYQVYDSLQAFSSSIAGLLASRAVLEGLGVGAGNTDSPNSTPQNETTSSPSATAIILLNIVQESTGRLATILFAHRLGTAFEPEAKRYRLLADIFNDVAMILDCLSPIIPTHNAPGLPSVWWGWYVRVLVLSTASTLRALCGVAAGSSKAILSQHFAIEEYGGSVGELNAKDASQETVISLLGMWTGSVVVSIITSRVATWVTLLVLLTVHLCMNWLAVRSVCMPTLNRQRANLVFAHAWDKGSVPKPIDVAQRERIFEKDGILRSFAGANLGSCQIGSSLQDLLHQMRATHHRKTKSFVGMDSRLHNLIRVFEQEKYLLGYDPRTNQFSIILKATAEVSDQLKAWNHAFIVASTIHGRQRKAGPTKATDEPDEMVELIRGTLKELNEAFPMTLAELEQAGWDIKVGALETRPGKRIGRIDKKK